MQSYSMIGKKNKKILLQQTLLQQICNTSKLNEPNEYFRNYLENIPTRNRSHGLTQKQVLPQTT